MTRSQSDLRVPARCSRPCTAGSNIQGSFFGASLSPLFIAAPLAGSLLARLRCAAPCQSRSPVAWPPCHSAERSQAQSRLFIRGRDLQCACSPAAIVTLSNRIRPAFRRWGARSMGRHEMDASLLIGAPLGLGILLALGILMVAMSYLSQ